VQTNRAPKSAGFAILHFAVCYSPLCPALYFFGFWRPNISCSAWAVFRASGNRAKNSRRQRHKDAPLEKQNQDFQYPSAAAATR
jgi:hypothetical protein